jgi:endoplasmic reticulum-Golgi intermediate compartment protein 3
MTHHIHKLRFGPQYPGRINALDGFDRLVDHDYGTFRYFLTIVPTKFVSASWWTQTETFSYSVSEYFVPGSAHDPNHVGKDVNVEALPSLQFRFDMSPIAVKVWYPDRALGHFLVRLCAVLGGCFALTQWLDKIVHAVFRLAGHA